MTIPIRSVLSPLLAVLSLLALVTGASAASSQLPVHRSAGASMSPVTVRITQTSGTIWGKVTARYTYHGHATSRSCGAATCTLQIPKGVSVHLSQTATDTATWPFKDWKITSNHKTKTVTTPTTSVRITGKATVSAVYVLHMAQSSQPPQPAYPYP